MPISRRDIIKLGVSYGTGVINHGNDSIAYDRELRKFPDRSEFAELRQALDEIDLKAPEPESGEGEEPGDAETTSATDGADRETGNREDFPQRTFARESETEGAADGMSCGKASADGANEKTADAADETGNADDGQANDPEATAPAEPNPTVEAAKEAVRAFRTLCGDLSLSSLYVISTRILEALEEECYPAAEDISELESTYDALVTYLRSV